MKRKRISKRYSKKLFNKTGNNVKRINIRTSIPRGGISL